MAEEMLLEKRFSAIAERAATARERAAAKAEEEASTPRQMFLPGFEEHMRAMPNYLSRNSLFAPGGPGRKKIHDGTVFHQTETVMLKGWGKQFTEDVARV